MGDKIGDRSVSFFTPSTRTTNEQEQSHSTIEIKFGSPGKSTNIVGNDAFFSSQQLISSGLGADSSAPSSFQSWGGKVLEALGLNTSSSPELVKESLTQEGYDEKYGSYNYDFNLDSGVCYVDGQKIDLSPEAQDYLNRSREYVGGINSYVEKNGDINFEGINVDARSTKAGEKLAEAAKKVAEQMNTVGYCYTGVAKSTDAAKLNLGLQGCSAYMAAEPNQLPATCTDITSQFGGKAYNLRAAPRGAIVVWPKAEASPHGHISVCLGNGIEASDHIAPQITNYRGNTTDFKVFMPKDTTA